MGDAAPEDQPLMGQQLGSNLTLNQTVGTTNAENEAFNRYDLDFQAEGGAQTNLFGTKTDQQTVGYMTFTADGALNLRSDRTRYYALYEPRYNVYPQYSYVNSFGQTFLQSLNHSITQHVWVYWDTTASRYLSLEQFLPPTLGIGGIGIVAPNLQTLLLASRFEQTNAATSLRLRNLMSSRMTFTATATGAFFLTVPVNETKVAGTFGQRFLTGGADLRLDYQMDPRDSIGAEITPIYVYGLSPKGHLAAEAVQGVFKRQLTAMTSVTAAAGPLFFQVSLPGLGSSQNISYAVNASVTRQIRQSQLTVGYSRAFIVSFLTLPTVAQQATLNAYIPMRRHWVLTAAASYARNSSQKTGSNSAAGYGGTIYGGSAQIAYLLGPKTEFYGIYSRFSQDFTYGPTQGYSYSQNKFGAGIRFTLGNPTTTGGMQ